MRAWSRNVKPAKAMQVSWIDAQQVNALAESLRREPTVKAPPEVAAPAMPVLLDEPVPFTADEPVHESAPVETPMVDFRSRLQAIRERAIRAGLMPSHQPISEAVPEEAPVPEVEQPEPLPPFEAMAGSASERIDAFASWAQPALDQSELFVVGDQGDLLWGQPAHSGLVLSAIMAWGATSRMSALSACETASPLRRVLATGSHLIVIPCATRLGVMHIAITGTVSLPDMHLPALRQALIAAMDAEG